MNGWQAPYSGDTTLKKPTTGSKCETQIGNPRRAMHSLSLSGNPVISSTVATTLGPALTTNTTDSLSAS